MENDTKVTYGDAVQSLVLVALVITKSRCSPRGLSAMVFVCISQCAYIEQLPLFYDDKPSVLVARKCSEVLLKGIKNHTNESQGQGGNSCQCDL